MDIRLNTFIVLAKIGNYTRAAEILNITQPAVTQHIKFLEEYYGVKIFKKYGRGMDLTEEGRILLKYAEEIQSLYRELKTEIKNKAGDNKVYNVGASMTIGGYVLPGILAKHKRIYKKTTILLHVHNTEEIIEMLLARKIDFALVEGPFDRKKFLYKKFKDDELVLAVSPEHDMAGEKQVDIKDVIRGNLILRERGSGTRKIFEDRLLEAGYELKDMDSYMEIGSISAIKSLVESNLGYTVISRETIKKELAMGTIRALSIKNICISREFNFIYLPERKGEIIDEFIGFCLNNS